ncbi:hypothetical protein ACQV2R_05125 [Facklamia sp. P12937]|uniref:hypothetical protein n=1 Tax=Facklamia sp. P12937 TaxID=3421949 RepID=UPI003D182A63
MRKKILFYKLFLENSKQLSLLTDDKTTLSDKVHALSEKYTDSDTFKVKNKKVFQLLTFDKYHIFGSFGKVEDLTQGDHIRARNKTNYSIEELEHFVETFSYFYIDLSNNDIALLNRSGLPDIKKPLEEFLSSHFRISGNWEVSIVPKFSENIENKLGTKVPVSKIKYVVENDKIPENEYASIKESYDISSSDMRKVTVCIDLLNQKDTFINKVVNKFKNYSEMTLENDDETIDLVEGIITKKHTIEIDNVQLKDTNSIKDLLRNALSAIS